ncbi:MAG: ATP-binding cassette domain-containing protein, partial [Promethearchaeota archaeon]
MSTIENIEELSTTETDDKYKQLPLTQFEQIGIKIGNVGIIAYLISLLLPLLLLPLYPIPWLTVSVPVLDEATNVLLSVKTNIYGFLGFFYLSRNKITWIGVSPILIVSTVISLIMAWHYFQIMKSYRSRDVGYDKIPSTLITLITWLLAIIIPSQYLEEVTTIGFTRKVESWGDAYHFYITGKGTFSVQETHYGLFLSLGCWLVACGFFIAILINYVTEKETRDLYPLISRTSIKFLPGRLGIRIFVVGACFAYVSAWAINLNNPGNPELEPYSISGLGFGIRIFFFEIPENYVTAFQIFLYAGISLLIAGYLFRKERLDEHHEWVNRAFLGSLIGLFIAWMVDGSKIAILGLISISRSMFVNLIDQNTLENTQFSIEYEGSTFIADIMATGGSLGSGPSILYTATLYGTLLLFVSAITEYFWWTVDKDLIITGELPNSIISVHHLIKFFEIRGGVLNRLAGYVHAVNNVTLEVPRGKTLGIVGESGCGKTTLGKTIIRLYEPTSGEMYYNGMDIASINLRQFHKYRRRMQMVFQDPYASMNPRVMIKDLLAEPIRAHKILPREKVIPYIVR